jgi:hypothetical protein
MEWLSNSLLATSKIEDKELISMATYLLNLLLTYLLFKEAY